MQLIPVSSEGILSPHQLQQGNVMNPRTVWLAAPGRRLAAVAVWLILAALPSLGALPAGWTDADIGWPALPGSASYSGGTWTVSGSGDDIGTTRISFILPIGPRLPITRC